MAEPHLDHPGRMSWYRGRGPAPVLGPCPHDNCEHWGTSVVGWGPTMERYELVECGSLDRAAESPGDCATTCRAWVDGDGRTTTAWVHVDLNAEVAAP